MFAIPEWFITFVFLLAAGILSVYGIIRWRRSLPVTWAWLALSCLQTAWTYYYFLTSAIPVTERVVLGRLSFTSLGVSIITVSVIASIYNVRKYKQ